MARGKRRVRRRKTAMKNRRKRAYRRRYRRNYISRNIIGANRMVRVLHYDEVGNLGPGSGTIASHVFRGNSLYDIDRSGLGHQPRGFDQIMNFYRRYTVLRTKVTVTFSNRSDAADALVGVAVRPSAHSPAFSSEIYDYLELPNSSSVLLSEQTSTSSVKTISRTIDHARYFGYKSVLSSSAFEGTQSVNPAQMNYIHIWATGQAGTAITVFAKIHFEIVVAFREPEDFLPISAHFATTGQTGGYVGDNSYTDSLLFYIGTTGPTNTL